MTKILVTAISYLLLSAQLQAACTPTTNITVTKPDSTYIDNLDGTVTDIKTGLAWAKCSLGQTWIANSSNDGKDDLCTGAATQFTWGGALDEAIAANASSYLGHTDWRLPNKKELESLTDKACANPAINTTLYPSTMSDQYWSASPYIDSANAAWFVDFSNGIDGGIYKYNGGLYVRLVRNTQ